MSFQTKAAASLASELRKKIRGEVRFDAGSRALYATDASNYRQVPIGVVLPKDTEDVGQTVALCRSYEAPVLPRGGGTSLAGQCCNVAVVLDFSKYMSGIVTLDPDQRQARVQPGLVLDTLRTAAAPFGLTFVPDPATQGQCTLGGMIGNNACGVHSLMGGKTEDNILELEILTYDGVHMRVGHTPDEELARRVTQKGRAGTIYQQLQALGDEYADRIRSRFPSIPRRVSGYNLPQLLPERGVNVARSLVGSEGTCATVLEATVQLVSNPAARALVLLGYPDVAQAADQVPDLLSHQPIGLEGIDHTLLDNLRMKGRSLDELAWYPDGRAWLLVEFGGASAEEAGDRARACIEAVTRTGSGATSRLHQDRTAMQRVWALRKSAVGATARLPEGRETKPGWEDAAVAPDSLGPYVRDFQKILERYGFSAALYGHFGEGCIHARIDFDLGTADGIGVYRRFIEEAADLVVHYGGSFSGEHGDGQSRGELLPRMYGTELVQAFKAFKTIWDPYGKMNPGKVVDPFPLDTHLRPRPTPLQNSLPAHFGFPDDQGSFERTTTRCIGVGACRRMEGGTMCPSYRATKEEMHSTRGRARLLYEMLQGDPVTKGWRNDHVLESLDLCLGCKGCRNDCPVNVDIATYKAEFLAHYYAGRLHPRAAYSMGLIFWWSRLASRAPRLANWAMRAPALGALMKRVAGIARPRAMPLFAHQSFLEWFRQHTKAGTGPRVCLWPDTFTNYFYPRIGMAAVEVLDALGYQIVTPSKPLCCGRPLYDFGMLKLAKRQWLQVMDALGPLVEADTPIIGLEPSCVAAFRDELPNMFANNPRATRLSRHVVTLAEFLTQHAADAPLPQLNRKAVVHGHCHQKAVMGADPDRQILEKIGLEAQLLDSGCCGMSGAFGFKAEHYDVSLQIGELRLLPAVRDAPKTTLILADGFSCREQIRQTTDREALHLAEVLSLARASGPGGPTGEYPERRHFTARTSP